MAGRTFRIHNDRYQHNVFEMADGKKIREFCAHTSHACPQEDHVLAQKLMLESCPEEFFDIANQWDLSRGGRILMPRRSQLKGAEELTFDDVARDAVHYAFAILAETDSQMKKRLDAGG